MASTSPRDRYLTIYGRKPVLEALADPTVKVAKVFLSERAAGPSAAELRRAAAARSATLEVVREEMVAAVARNGRHHQGVAADIAAPGLSPLDRFLEGRRGRAHATSVIVLDHVHNPANVGMVIRSAAAAGLDGVVVPRRGTAELGPLVIKASAGVALTAPLLTCERTDDALAALAASRFTVVGLATTAVDDLFTTPELPERAAYVVGNESEGLTDAAADRVERWLRIPMSGGVDSLNVACAATLLAFEVTRRREVARARARR